MTLTPGKVVLSNPLTCTNTPKGENKLYSDAKGVVPSLDLRFAEGKTLNDYMTGTPLVDHQRSMSGSNLSPGTFVNSNGLIETSRTNLLLRSEEFDNASWVKTRSSVSADVIASPDGNTTADYLVENGTNNNHFLGQMVSCTSGTAYTVSIYAKAGGRSILQSSPSSLYLTTLGYVNYDLSSGTVAGSGGGASGSIVDVGNGWYRCITTFTANATRSGTFAWFLQISGTASRGDSYQGDGTSGIYLWGAQLEEGATATTYIPTTNVPSAAPRFDHDPTTGESLGLLIEEARTNIYTFSSEFSDSAWSKNEIILTPNAGLAPDGTFTSTKISATTVSTDEHRLVHTTAAGVGVQSIWSVYAKAGENTKIGLRRNASDGLDLGQVDLITGSLLRAVPGYTTTIQDAGNGWWRISLSFSSTAAANLRPCICPIPNSLPTTADADTPYTDDGTSGIYIWGAQLEEGSFSTSYIPTTGTALTRSADVASITGSNFSSWYNQSEGTVFIDVLSFPSGWKSANRAFIYISDTTVGALSANDGIKFGSGTSSNTGRLYVTEAGTNSINFGLSTLNKIAIGLALGDGAVYADGSLVGTSASVAMPVGMDRLAFTTAGTGKEHIARLTYFPDRLEDSVLQTITQ